MKKIAIYIVMAALCLNFQAMAQLKNSVTGLLLTDNGSPVIGATVKTTDNTSITQSDRYGRFTLSIPSYSVGLVITSVGFLSKSIIEIKIPDLGIIRLTPDAKQLNEVEIVNTGYQSLPKERATGSFTALDTKTINRGVGINILDRLEGVTSGVLLNRGLNLGNNAKLSIHGRSTIFANADPLIVLNGVPYPGTIDQINPADIESINILKDAAASSIWGTKSGNGVIVITTKSGRYNQLMKVNVSSTLSVSGKPDLNYAPFISSADYIELERYLFNKGLFQFQFSNPYNSISPAVEIFNQAKLGLISSADSASRINALKGYDIRNDLDKYVYRSKVLQQYQLNISGGSENHNYYLSAGYDKNLGAKVMDKYDRIVLNANNSYSLLNNRLSFSADINFTSSNTFSGMQYNPISPYERMADETGQSLPVTTTAYRMSYVDTAGNGKLLDWYYRPKDELASNNHNRINQYRIKAGVDYKILEGFNLTTSYQFLKENSLFINSNDINSYDTRNLINQYSAIQNGAVFRVVPLGDIRNETAGDLVSKLLRTQLNFSRKFSANHEVNGLIGYEGSDSRSLGSSQVLYGYDSSNRSTANGTINPFEFYPFYYQNAFSGQISTAPLLSSKTDINQSFYINGSYSYKNRYIFSGSARRDESNIFGVKTNQKGVPLWSSGLAWIVNEERFYNLRWLPYLKLRATYGVNGNYDKSVSAFLTAISASNQLNLIGNLFNTLLNPPNPSLRWEKIKTWNIGVDFASESRRVTGSLDVYSKKSTDLIGNNPIAFQSGILQFKGNGADLNTKGLDLIINSQNIKGNFSWNSSVLFNYIYDKVTKYKIKQGSNLNIVSNNYQNPVEGYPYHAVFSFPSAGLDQNGAPQGYLNGLPSKDYSSIITGLNIDQIKYHGTATPKFYGSLLNTFHYKNLELSFNLTYKYGYYQKRTHVFTGSNYGSGIIQYQLAEFENRWKKQGDELITKIPALSYPLNSSSNSFFANSDDLVIKGDHIRLQDIKLNYNIPLNHTTFSVLNKAEIFLYARNLGILWRKNKQGIDPDFGSFNIPEPITGSIGINLLF